MRADSTSLDFLSPRATRLTKERSNPNFLATREYSPHTALICSLILDTLLLPFLVSLIKPPSYPLSSTFRCILTGRREPAWLSHFFQFSFFTPSDGGQQLGNFFNLIQEFFHFERL